MKKFLAMLLAAAMLLGSVALADDTIRFGIFEPMTGSYAGAGAMELEGFELANEMFPEVLGRKIELVIGDSKSDKTEATAAAEWLVGQDIVAVLGSNSSGLCLAGSDVFAMAEIPALTATGTNPTITLLCDWYARACFIDPFQGTMLARFCVEQGYKNVAIIQEIESEYAVGLVKYFQEELAKHEGFTVTTIGNFNNADQDFTTHLTTALAQNPDVIFTPVGFAPSAALIASQARQLGYNGPIIGGDTLDASELYDIAGDAAEGVVFSTFYDAAQPATELTTQFLDAYRAKYGKEPSGITIMAFDAYLMMRDAIERAGTTDNYAVMEALAETNGFIGAAGAITLDENRDAVRPVVFKRVVDVKEDGSVVTEFVMMVEPE